MATSQLGFHHGKVLLKVANTYTSLHETILENTQNSIDANATKIGISINRRDRSIYIYDNGDGASRAKFEEALMSVGSTIKKEDKLGQFGLGLISHLGKCEYATFTSCPRTGGDGYLEWKFETTAIAAQKDGVNLPRKPRSLVYDAKAGPDEKGRNGVKPVSWRTRVYIHGYTKDRKISEIRGAQALLDAIIEKFGVVMRRNDVTVSVQIINEDGTKDNASGKAKSFSGKKLSEIIISDRDAGDTVFRLFLARKQTVGYKGQVLIGIAGDDYRLPFRTFAKSAGNDLTEGVVELFKSGFFEGEIIVQNAKLHDSRRKLEHNDAYMGFCVVIEEWFLEHGKKHVKEVKEERQGQRLQELSVESLRNVESLLSDPAFESFRKETIDSFAYGNMGAGHADPLQGKAAGKQGYSSVSTAAGKPKLNGTAGEGHSGGGADHERPTHAPFTVAGPKGQDRQKVRGGSRGLQLDFLAMGSTGALAFLEPSQGKVFFNTDHADWIAADRAGDRELVQLQEVATIVALAHHTMPPDYQKVADLAFSEALKPLAYLLRSSPSFNLRARFKALKKD